MRRKGSEVSLGVGRVTAYVEAKENHEKSPQMS